MLNLKPNKGVENEAVGSMDGRQAPTAGFTALFD